MVSHKKRQITTLKVRSKTSNGQRISKKNSLIHGAYGMLQKARRARSAEMKLHWTKIGNAMLGAAKGKKSKYYRFV